MRHAKAMQAKSRKCSVKPVGFTNKAFDVTSTSGNTYRVYVNQTTGVYSCGCKYAEFHPGESGCSHVVAAMEFVAETTANAKQSVWAEADPDAVKRQKHAIVAKVDGLVFTQRFS